MKWRRHHATLICSYSLELTIQQFLPNYVAAFVAENHKKSTVEIYINVTLLFRTLVGVVDKETFSSFL
jgi:hypothetical protein